MEKIKAVFKKAWPYNQHQMNLPVKDVTRAIPFYEEILAFKLDSLSDSPPRLAVLSRDDIQIGIAENGGDPSQEGCFFEVDNINAALEELKSNGLRKETADFSLEQHGNTKWKVFYVVAPDGLCYCLGERQN